MDNSSESKSDMILSTAQRARMERNRLRALALRDAKLVPQAISAVANCTSNTEGSVIRLGGARLLDTGGGFLLNADADDADDGSSHEPTPAVLKRPAPIVDVNARPPCRECDQPIAHSYLFDTFDYAICDSCRDDEGAHALMTRTEAKAQYLLQDCDLDIRPPPLRCVLRANPHNPRGARMRLYLRAAVEERALLVWGSEEALRAELERRDRRRERLQHGKYARQLRTLRMDVRGSLYERRLGARTHVHTFGAEQRDEDNEDSFWRRCEGCGHMERYEKM
ncbi:DNA repair protein complementing XP-A cells homolog [Eumeta japonica]|uniref:DNA repair protein complementing XP-A cells homolog n=1 Tax=Eumeta variegata TaxID=151549 RepID=A0A4C1UGQ2_EUMVA|nr:DNA repair protein complementing XP-A cells homolog [Eumeta japonica]